MAFGGVATGNIKAHEAATAISAERITGDTPNASATVAKTGTSSAALAVLLANSVRNTTKLAITKIVKNKPACSRKPLRLCAKKTLVPVAFSTLLRQIPPPNRINTPQSVDFSISFHSTTRDTPSRMIANKATKVSNLLKPPKKALTGLLNIHKETVSAKIASVISLPLSHLTGVWSSSNVCERFGFKMK
ncbi:hypothetical protein P3TCK_20490 [Photobacterium profundum 3TCK]|uniref:Uncharacterized protein n=1 Tax=Photobacterium profundum 3TCK TaxID=314280 RepID=Q1Z958_9GAMM|nr:hypothetical protein P3TCK_20490 [Photobacterium profundum 3TCK]